MKLYINKYSYVDSNDKEKINAIITEQTNVINNCNSRIETLQKSWLQTTNDLTWKHSSFANNERANMDRASRSIEVAKEILQQIKDFKN
jgi:hypothetical protein